MQQVGDQGGQCSLLAEALLGGGPESGPLTLQILGSWPWPHYQCQGKVSGDVPWFPPAAAPSAACAGSQMA
jgi:hypothetical protein